MLSYMLPTEDKPPPGNPSQHYQYNKLQSQQQQGLKNASVPVQRSADLSKAMNATLITKLEDGTSDRLEHGQVQDFTVIATDSPKHNGNARKSTLHTSRVTKDESLYSIDSEASTGGSDRKNKFLNGAKHANLKRVSFGSSKGSMVETLVYETPVQEEPEINHFLDHNGRLAAPMIPVPDTDEGREKVRVSFLGPKPFPATPGVLLLDPDMGTNGLEILTTHTEHTSPSYNTQLSTDNGWDNPFRPDGDLSREADEIVELIKGGKPITPTPGQTSPPLPGSKSGDHDSSTSPLLNASARLNQGNGNAHSTPIKGQQSGNEKATVEVSRVTSQGPGDASQVEHVTLKKKPKCKCCVLQ